MLTEYPSSEHAKVSPSPRKVLWIDLLRPTRGREPALKADTASTSLATSFERSRIVEPRLGEKRRAVLEHANCLAHERAGRGTIAARICVVEDLLVTIRYTDLRSFQTVAEKLSKDAGPASSVDAFAALVDEIVDLSADLLEEIAAELDAISRTVFSKRGRQPHVTRSNDELRDLLIDIGNAGARLSRIGDSVLSLQRIVAFASGTGREWLPQKMREHLSTPQNDLLSLNEYETHLSDKVQFLLDAALGFINTKQNDIFQVLTVISVVGIPPTLVASIYGMNFRNMPELNWAWGYQYGLALIPLSAVVPILWFKWRRWV